MTIRDMIAEYQTEVAKGSLTPSRAAEILSELSALIGNINDAIRKADLEYNQVLLHFYETEEKANRAKIKAECSPEYTAKRTARDTLALADAMIGSLKYLCRSFEKEWRHTGNM